ncbi:MAG: sulfatase [Carboxylicivirga sp.]|nr:sulfatase [Carboxylicivirga sp.]
MIRALIFVFIITTFFACQPKTEPTNVIWLLCEDMSADLGCNGNSIVHTPTLDSLASQGVLYNNVFTTAAVCTPSRTALATGMYQTSINAHHMRYYSEDLKNELPAGILPLNEVMRQNGYQTANIKCSYGTAKTDWSFKSDMAYFDLSKWEEIDPSKPFFAVVNFSLTHRGFARDKQKPVNADKVNVPPYYPNHPIVRNDFAAYYESIQVLDKKVAKALSDIKKHGLDKNTVICFFSDHGRPMTRAKMFTYDSGLKVPVIISAGNAKSKQELFKKGTVDNRLMSFIDISATTLELAGIKVPEWMQGKSFVDDDFKGREAVFSASDRIGGTHLKTRSVRTNKYHYIRNYIHNTSVNEAATNYRKANHPIYHVLNELDKKGTLTKTQKNLVSIMPEEELYDIESDPFETINLAINDEYSLVLKELREQLKQWQNETLDYGMQPDSPELEKSFEDYKSKSEKNNRKKIENLKQRIQNEINDETI